MHFKEQRIENSSPKDRFVLTKESALFRSQQIENVTYALTFNFKSMSRYYYVETTITFDLLDKEQFILDCGCSALNKLIINGITLNANTIKRIWKNNGITIPKEYLLDRKNVIYVKSCNKFSRNSSGFHSYIDQKERKQYCYTICPPNYAHLIYPCFDQPDLKATFELKVKAPAEWTVVSNASVYETKLESRLFFPIDTYKWWNFNKTPVISTYLFSIAAGDFIAIESENPTIIPMKLYCTYDKYEYLFQESQEFFSLIEAGINFYNQFFGMNFPFEKYDQVFCPEFKYIAMENPGMVCITENYIFLTQTSPSKKIQRALTLLHELSHMWFGNLVTMKWWDDLWLNEGFATFISYYSLPLVSKDPIYEDLEVKFFCYKQEALEIDGLNSTHPVTQDVKDTEDATNIFDDITYAKGSAVIKHLMYTIGAENFSKSLTRYFQRYKWSNADSKDFFRVIEEVLEEDKKVDHNYLEKWVYDWIRTEGKQNLSYDLEFKEDNVEIFIRQENLPQRVSVTKHAYLEIAVFYLDQLGNIVNLPSQRTFLTDTRSIVTIKLENIDRHKMGVVVNYKDYSYIDIIMDDTSLNFFLANFSKLEPLLKVQTFFSMVKKVQLGRSNPVQLFKHISDEFQRGEVPYLYSEYLIYGAKIFEHYLPENIKASCAKMLFPKLFCLLNTQRQSLDDKMNDFAVTIQEYIVNFAYSSEDVLSLLSWSQQDTPNYSSESRSGVLMGRIIEEIFWRKLLEDHEREFIKREHVADQPYFFNFVTGATAKLNDKWSLWQKYINFEKTAESQYEISCIMKGFNNPYSEDKEVFAEKFFEDLIFVFETNENEYNTTFFTNLFPRQCNLGYVVKRVKELLQKEKLSSNLRTLLEKKLQQLEICQSLEKFI